MSISLINIFLLITILSNIHYSISIESTSTNNDTCNSDNDRLALYTDIIASNTTDSLERIKKINLRFFEFIYDSVPGRKQLGILGEDARRYFPDAVEVVPTYPIPSKDRNKPPTVLTNFPLVDKNVIFMHGLGALKELINGFDQLQDKVNLLNGTRNEHLSIVEDIERRLIMELDSQTEERLLIASKKLELADKEKELETLRSEEERRVLAVSIAEEKSLREYEEEQTIKRMKFQEKLSRESMENSILLEKELEEKKQLITKKAEDTKSEQNLRYNIALEEKKSEFEKEKIKAELKAKSDNERANEDIQLRKLETQAKLDTERMKQSIINIGFQLSTMVKNLLSEPDKVGLILSIFIMGYIILYLAKELIQTMRNIIQTRLGRPSLVRETSVNYFILPSFLTPSYYGLFKESLTTGLALIEKYFNNVVLNEQDKDRVIKLALATRNTKSTGAPYRHFLLHGPPGTGKTLIARKLAECSGMDYAVMSGGDVGPLGEDAVNQLNNLFKWAQRSRKGLLLFIDEAEAFLSSRGNSGSGTEESHSRHALNALLYQTGTESIHFMLVLATNRPEDLDSAILDRMDISMKFDLPEYPQRFDLVKQYMKEHVINVANLSKQKWTHLFGVGNKLTVLDECYSDDTYATIANLSNGFSGREISKLYIAIQYSMLLAEDQILTKLLLEQTVELKIAEHKEKKGFTNINKKINNIVISSFSPSSPSSYNSKNKNIEVEEIVEVDNSNIEKEQKKLTSRKSSRKN
jgi:ATPase family AAA domain-containing protein 3A/B